MAVNFCLPPQLVESFKGALAQGRIDPTELAGMGSEERHAALADLVGPENALGVNSLFESKLLLKNQQQGYITWAKSVAGLKPEVRRDLINRIQKMDRVLNPEEEQGFLKDLAHTRLGVGVSLDEAKKITELSKRVEATKAAMDKGGNRLEYGLAKVELGNYVSGLKNDAKKLSLREAVTQPGQAISKTAGLAKSIKASLDNSAIFRQGWKTLWTNPREWQKNARQSFADIVHEFGGKNVMDQVNADIASRPTYDKMVKAKLAIGTVEEAYPTSLPEKIPVLGRAFKASETAYTGFIYRQRADIFDKYLQIAQKSGVNVNDKKELQAIGKVVNALTGRGNLGRLEGGGADAVNNIFFSPRFVKSNIDLLTLHAGDKGITPFARKQAALNLLKVISGTAGVLGVAHAVAPNAVDFDPRNSDFGKIKAGNTRFDVTGGMGSLATLASRLITQSSKSSTTGIVKPLNSGYGSQTGTDVVVNFLENKLSPAASLIKDLVAQKDFQGNKPTVAGEASNLLVPLPVTTYQELKNDPESANALLSMIADGLGIATNTYGKAEADWSQNPSKELGQFKQKVGEAKFKQANAEFNKRVDQWTKDNKNYIHDLPNDQKQAGITKAKQDIQNSVFKSYGFKYKQPPLSDALKQLRKENRAKAKQ